MTQGIIKAAVDASGISTGDKSQEKKRGDPGAPGPHSKDWPHAPIHRLTEHGIYMVTASTLDKQKVFRTNDQLDLLEGKLLTLAKQYGWQLEAWAVFQNHYHFVGRGLETSQSLKKFLAHLHADSARELNRMDDAVGRQVWFNFWTQRSRSSDPILPGSITCIRTPCITAWCAWRTNTRGVLPHGLNALQLRLK